MIRQPSTARLLELYGGRKFRSNISCHEEWHNTTDMNRRYQIRVIMLQYWITDAINALHEFATSLSKLAQA